MRLRVAPSAAAVLPPRSAPQAQSPRHSPQAISPPRCLSSPHPPFFLRRRIRRLSTPKNPPLVPTHPSLVRLSEKSGLSHSQSPPHPLLPSVSGCRRIRRSAPPPHPFPVKLPYHAAATPDAPPYRAAVSYRRNIAAISSLSIAAVSCSRIAAVSCSRNAVTRRNIMQPYHAAATRRRIEPPYRCCRSLL